MIVLISPTVISTFLKNKTMKQILILISLLTGFYSHAQELNLDGNNQTYTQYTDSIFEHLNKSQLLNNSLYDRVYPFANLTEYSSEKDTITAAYFLQAYSEIERSKYDFVNQEGVFYYKDFNNFIESSNDKFELPIFAINYSINYIDTLALSDDRIANRNNMLYIGSDSSSPFLSKKIQMMALGIKDALFINKFYKIKLFFPASIYQGSENITSIKITSSLMQKTWTIVMGINDSIQFDKFGNDVLLIEAFKDNVKLFSTTQEASYKMDNSYGLTTCEKFISSVLGYQPYLEPGTNVGFSGEGQYVVFYGRINGQCRNKVTKPIIISDAWDPGDTRAIYHNVAGFNWYDYKKSNEDIYHKHLTYTSDGTIYGAPTNLVEQMRDLGYDVIIVDYLKRSTPAQSLTINVNIGGNIFPLNVYVPAKIIDGGSDFIQRNAQTMVQVILNVNTEMTSTPNPSTEKIVIVGPSMGGQITRYALRWMEINNLNHNCRLWVSFDSPHHGANILYALQETIRYLGDNFGSMSAQEFLNNQIRVPGAQQMLNSTVVPYEYDPPTSNATAYNNQYDSDKSNNLNGNNTLHTSYYNEINNMGMPQNLRKVALINGRYTGGDYHIAGSKMFDLRIYKNSKKWWTLFHNETYYMNSSYDKITQNYKFGGTGCQYCLWGSYNTNNYGPLDSSPGGQYDVQQELYDEINQKTLPIQKSGIGKGFAEITNSTNTSSFIPSFSSLAIINKNIDWPTPINISELVCQQNTPFDNIYSPSENESHTNLNVANVNWILQEIDKGQHIDINCVPICAFKFTTNLITLCTNSNATLTLNSPIPNLSNYFTTWTCSPNIQIVSSTNNSVTVIGLSYGINCFIKAEINNPCGANVVIENRNISVGKPSAPSASISISPTVNCYKWDATVQFPTPPAGATFDWGVGVYPNCNTSSCLMTGTNAGTFSKLMTSGQYIQWSSSATNACGTEDNPGQILQLDVTSCSPFTAQLNYIGVPLKTNYPHNSITTPDDDIIIFPNPSSTHWTISIMKNEITEFSYSLMDITGKILKQYSYTNINLNDIVIDNHNLPIGSYILNIRTASNSYNFKVLKN